MRRWTTTATNVDDVKDEEMRSLHGTLLLGSRSQTTLLSLSCVCVRECVDDLVRDLSLSLVFYSLLSLLCVCDLHVASP